MGLGAPGEQSCSLPTGLKSKESQDITVLSGAEVSLKGGNGWG